MSNTINEVVTVDALSKFGFKSGSVYYNWSQKIADDQKGKVVPGATFDLVVYVADSGKKYVNEVKSLVEAGKVPAVPTESKPEEKPKYTGRKVFAAKSESSGLSKDEWAAKDVRISRQGCIQAAVHAMAPIVAPEAIFVEASKLADQMLEYVNKK